MEFFSVFIFRSYSESMPRRGIQFFSIKSKSLRAILKCSNVAAILIEI